MNQQSNFVVHGNRRPWIFATMAEANKADNDIFQRKGIVVSITATDKAATHHYPEVETVQ